MLRPDASGAATARLAGLSFFFPAYNEEGSVEAVVREALAVLPRFADDLEVIVVDDGSTDRTGEIADRLATEDPHVRVVHHRPNRGYGAAVRSGLASARKPFVFYTDGDQQFKLEDLDRLIAHLDGADVVVGYRERRADPPRRLFIAAVYNTLIRVLFAAPFRDVDCAFKLFRRDALERVPLDRVRSNGAFFSPEHLLVMRAAHLRMEQVGVRHFPRALGEEKGATPRVVARAMRDLFLLRLRLWSPSRDGLAALDHQERP